MVLWWSIDCSCECSTVREHLNGRYYARGGHLDQTDRLVRDVPKDSTSGWQPPDDRLTAKVLETCDAVGTFIEWWGFKAIHGRIWTLLALHHAPMSQAAISRSLGVSRALVSGAVSEMMEFGLIHPTRGGRQAPYTAVMDIWPIISDILREREWRMVEAVQMALEAALEEAELADNDAAPRWSAERMQLILGLTEMAHTFLKIIVSLRMPKSMDSLGPWLARASTLLGRLRN